jgi:hypothetical protein
MMQADFHQGNYSRDDTSSCNHAWVLFSTLLYTGASSIIACKCISRRKEKQSLAGGRKYGACDVATCVSRSRP